MQNNFYRALATVAVVLAALAGAAEAQTRIHTVNRTLLVGSGMVRRAVLDPQTPNVQIRVFVNGNELLVGDVTNRGKTATLYGDGVVLRATEDGTKWRVLVVSVNPALVRILLTPARAINRLPR